MAGWIATALYLLDLTIKVVALGFVPKNRRPSSGMAWLLLIFIIPFVGLLIFLLLGRTRLERKRWHQQAEVNALVAERIAGLPALSHGVAGPAYLESVATLNRNLGALPCPRRQPDRPVPGLRRVDRGHDGRGGSGDVVGARGVLHHRLGRRDQSVLRRPGASDRARRDASGCSSTTSDPGASPATRTSGRSWTPPRSSGTRCCRSTCSRASGDVRTSATTARSSSSTGGSPSPARRT